MRQFPRFRGLTLGTVLLALLGTTGCAPPDALPSADGTGQPEHHKVPFHEADEKTSSPNPSAVRDTGPKADADLPFQEPQNLPAGTLLTVRTKNPISAENRNANGTFEAMVDQPVVIDGNLLVPLGAMVSGRVESAQASNLKGNRGYVRLTLESIQLAKSNVPVQTSSLFVRGRAGQTQAPQNPMVRLEKGRLLVFRLTEPADVAAGQRPPRDH
jgi:hypothetical protein